jgi:hypothetical protein
MCHRARGVKLDANSQAKCRLTRYRIELKNRRFTRSFWQNDGKARTSADP